MKDLQKHKDDLARKAFGKTKADAQTTGTCIKCGSSVYFDIHAVGVRGAIYSPQGLKEYGISGLCETCFDNMFEEDDNDA